MDNWTNLSHNLFVKFSLILTLSKSNFLIRLMQKTIMQMILILIEMMMLVAMMMMTMKMVVVGMINDCEL